MSDEVMELDLVLKQVQLKLKGKDGVVRNYTMQEITGTERSNYMNRLMQRAKFSKAGTQQGLKDYKDLEAELLHDHILDDAGKKISVSIINSWGSSAITKLVKKAKEISGLGDDKEEEEAAKNDSEEKNSNGTSSPTNLE